MTNYINNYILVFFGLIFACCIDYSSINSPYYASLAAKCTDVDVWEELPDRCMSLRTSKVGEEFDGRVKLNYAIFFYVASVIVRFVEFIIQAMLVGSSIKLHQYPSDSKSTLKLIKDILIVRYLIQLIAFGVPMFIYILSGHSEISDFIPSSMNIMNFGEYNVLSIFLMILSWFNMPIYLIYGTRLCWRCLLFVIWGRSLLILLLAILNTFVFWYIALRSFETSHVLMGYILRCCGSAITYWIVGRCIDWKSHCDLRKCKRS